jgi:hypothetical protein
LAEHLSEPSKIKPAVIDTDGSLARREAFRAMSDENKRRLDEAHSAAADPAMAADEVRKIMQKIGA